MLRVEFNSFVSDNFGLFYAGSPVGVEYCEIKATNGNLGLMKMENDSSCFTSDLSALPLQHTIFDIRIQCSVTLMKFSLTGAECSDTITYGPYIGGVQIVEMFVDLGQPCHTPFITTVKKDGKCLVTVKYNNIGV